MPIKPENRHRYPKDWPAIRARILDRAGHCCEGSPAYPECRAANKQPHPVTGSRVVLTIAHLDHVPEECDPERLRAWCQRCHLTYDAAHRKAERVATLRAQDIGLAEELESRGLWLDNMADQDWETAVATLLQDASRALRRLTQATRREIRAANQAAREAAHRGFYG